MTFEEKLFYNLLQGIYTISICEIMEINTSNSFMLVQPVTGGSAIPEVPMWHIGSTNTYCKIKMNVGDIIPVLHTKDDISLFLDEGKKGPNDNNEKFSKTNAIGLPLRASIYSGGFTMPAFDFEFKGNIKIDGDLTLNGDLTQDGTQQVTGIINSDSDVTAGPIPISLVSHAHEYINPEHASPIQPGVTTPSIKP